MDSIESGSGGLGDRPDVGDDGIAAAEGALDDGDIDDVVVTGLPGQDADVLGQVLAHRLGVAHAEETAQAGLPGTSSP